MIYFMPVFMLVLFNNFPAGLACTGQHQVSGTLQQYYIEKKNKKSVAEATAKKK